MENITKIIEELQIKDKCAFVGQYYVPDHNAENCEILFVVESPHSDEIIHKHPLAGAAGINLSNALCAAAASLNKTFQLTTDKPFGCWLKDSISNYYGILNICNIPLQNKIYSCKYAENLKQLNIIRTLFDSEEAFNKTTNDVKQKYQDTYQQIHDILLNDDDANQKHYEIIKVLEAKNLDNIFRYVIDDLQRRFNPLSQKNITIIACGHITKNLLQSANIKFTHYIMHPSAPSYGSIQERKSKRATLKQNLSNIEYIFEY